MTRGSAVIGGALAALVSAARLPAQDAAVGSRAARTAQLARGDLRDGRFDSAANRFAEMLDLSLTPADSADALFGRAFVRLQLGAASTTAVTDSLVATYRKAAALDSARLFGRAQYNIAVVYADAGSYDKAAAAAALGAAATRDSLRQALVLSAAQNYVAANMPDSAEAYLRAAAIAGAPVSAVVNARLALYQRTGRRVAAVGLGDSLTTLADSGRPTDVPLRGINDAMLGLLTDVEWKNPTEQARCLVVLARSNAAMDLEPSVFAARQAAVVQRLAVSGDMAAGARALLDAYRPRERGAGYVEPADAEWWHATLGRRTVWSETLRSIGDAYNRAGAESVAASFFEAAIGEPRFDPTNPWIDLRALPPLASIYASSADTASDPAARARITAFQNSILEGKTALYLAHRDYPRIRAFHLTLGTLFALRGQWGGGINGAIYHIERLRELTRTIGVAYPTLADPPILLELLTNEYTRRGCFAAARDVATDAAADYRRAGALDDAQRMAVVARALAKRQGGAVGRACVA